jgi:hypothetical protein
VTVLALEDFAEGTRNGSGELIRSCSRARIVVDVVELSRSSWLLKIVKLKRALMNPSRR